MAKRENLESTPESNIESDSPYLDDAAVSEKKASWLTSRAAKITAIAVGASLALGAAFAGGAVAGQLSGGARDGNFGIGQNGPQFDGGPHSDDGRPAGPDGQRPPHGEKGERGEGEDHDGPKSFGPPVGATIPSAAPTTP